LEASHDSFFPCDPTRPHRDEVAAVAACIGSGREPLGAVAVRGVDSAPGIIDQTANARRYDANATSRKKAAEVIVHIARELTHDPVNQQTPR
jgi:hypothetical protein